jgi:hypothetical protein
VAHLVALIKTSHLQDAVRILVLLHACGDRRDLADAPHGDAVAVIRAESRLQALDFWLRNPDYLAYEVLDNFEERGDVADIELARDLLADEVRAFPALRHLYGAYTEIDRAMGVLRSLLLAWDVRRAPAVRRRRDIYLLPAGQSLIDDAIQQADDLAWYVDRAQIVATVAGPQRGRALKDHQKRLTEYRDIAWGAAIEPIADRVRERLGAFEEAR